MKIDTRVYRLTREAGKLDLYSSEYWFQNKLDEFYSRVNRKLGQLTPHINIYMRIKNRRKDGGEI